MYDDVHARKMPSNYMHIRFVFSWLLFPQYMHDDLSLTRTGRPTGHLSSGI